MNKLLLAVSAASLVVASCAKTDNFEVSGNIENADQQYITLQRIDLNSIVLVDSVKVKQNGTYSFLCDKLTEPTFFQLKLKNGKEVMLLADSTEHIVVNADMKNIDKSLEISQSIGSQQLNELTKKASDLQKTLFALNDKFNKASNDAERNDIYKTRNSAISDYKAFVNGYVFENPRSFVSYYALFQNILDMPIFDIRDNSDQILFATVATSLNLQYPENDRVRHLYDYVLQAKAIQKKKKMNDQLLNSAEAVNSPDIQAPDKDGNMIKLSSLRGKVVLLTYWASQSEASRKSNRQLVSIYNKYNSRGLEIYQVSLDQSKILWEDAVEKDGISKWVNVCDLQSVNSIAARIYNVQSVPSNYIIDRNGELIGKDLWGSRLDERMAQIFR